MCLGARTFNLDGTDYIMLTKDAYANLLRDSEMLEALECAGVDNWVGYSEALSEFCSDED